MKSSREVLKQMTLAQRRVDDMLSLIIIACDLASLSFSPTMRFVT
jgi:hypothetical protein